MPEPNDEIALRIGRIAIRSASLDLMLQLLAANLIGGGAAMLIAGQRFSYTIAALERWLVYERELAAHDNDKKQTDSIDAFNEVLRRAGIAMEERNHVIHALWISDWQSRLTGATFRRRFWGKLSPGRWGPSELDDLLTRLEQLIEEVSHEIGRRESAGAP